MPYCRKHPNTKLICPSCMAARAGTSARKAKSSARNGRLGGRPKLPKHAPGCDVGVTGRYTEGCPRCLYDARKFTAQDGLTRQVGKKAIEKRSAARMVSN